MTGKKRYKRVTSIALLIMLLWINMFVSLAEESDLVTLKVSDTRVQMGSSLTLTLSIDSSIDATEIGIEGLENFDVESTSQSSSSSNINGVKSSLYQYVLTLAPKEVGEYNLKAIVNDGQNTYESISIRMTVIERDDSLDGEEADVFIKTMLSDQNYYFGENIVLTYELYSRYNLDDYGFLDDVTYNDFIVESTAKENLKSSIVTINGNKYLKQVVKEDVLTPTKSGEFEIPSYSFQANLSTGDFFSRSEPRYLDTEPVSFTVKELPTTNKPVDFTGIVGQLDVKTTVDKSEVSYGDAMTLNVILTASGNLDSIGKLYNNESGFTIYETEKFSQKSIVDQSYIQSKEYEIIIVPEDVGDLVLEAIPLWYFDTEVNDYVKVEIPQQTIKVTGVKEDTSVSNQAVKSEAIFISQINAEDKNDDIITLNINKNHLYSFIMLVVVIGLFIVLVKVKTRKPKLENKKEYLKFLKEARTTEMLETLIEKIVVEETGLNIKSQHRKTIINDLATKDQQLLFESIILNLESNKVNKKDDITEIKKELKAFIEAL